MDTNEINVAFDLEANGLEATRIHCIVTQDLKTGLVQEYNDEKYAEDPKSLPMAASRSIANGLSDLMVATNVVSHNGIAYDVPQAKKIVPFFRDFKSNHWDTLILSRFYYPNLLDIDLRRKWAGMPAKLYGSHSLEAYGYRLKCYKGDYGKTSDWSEWTPEMQEYCKQDVAVLVKLWKHFQKFLTQ